MNMKPSISLPVLTVVVAANTLGCYSTWDLSPEMVVQLDGFNGAPKSITVKKNGNSEPLEFSSSTYLNFRDLHGTEVSAQFRRLRMNGGVLVGVERSTGDQLNVDMAQMKAIQVAELSPIKTTLLTTAYIAGIIPLGFTLFGYLFAAEGRPLRRPGQTLPTLADLRADRYQRRNKPVLCSDESTRASVFRRWAQAAREECASIPAFLALARDLSLVSAPASLVRAAQRAAAEEATHTRLCTSLANEHALTPVTAHAPPTPCNIDIDPESLLQRLAVEAFWDGCMGEGTAARTARNSAKLARDEKTRLALRTIARDEANHAALARDVLAYCLSVGGRRIRDVLKESYERRRRDEESCFDTMANTEEESLVDWEFAQNHGMSSANAKRTARGETWGGHEIDPGNHVVGSAESLDKPDGLDQLIAGKNATNDQGLNLGRVSERTTVARSGTDSSTRGVCTRQSATPRARAETISCPRVGVYGRRVSARGERSNHRVRLH